MIQYSTLTGIVRLNKEYVTKVVAFCKNITENGEFFFTRSDAGKVHGFASAEELEEHRRYMLSIGYTECPWVSL